MGKLKRETTRSRAAYGVFCALGPTRSLTKLRTELLTLPEWSGHVPSQRYIEEWSSSHRWHTRAEEYDKAVQEARNQEKSDLKQKTNEEHYAIGRDAAEIAVAQIQRLIQVEKFGSQASVQLLKLATDLQRLALGLDRPDADKAQTNLGVQIIIETDTREAGPPQITGARIVEDVPLLSEE